MLFESFSHPEEWDLVNFRLKQELGTQNQVRSYINPFLAVHDLLVSLAQLYAHKRSIAWVTGVSPLLENSQPHFVRESYQVQNIKMSDLLQAADGGQSIIEGLNKDTLFLVFFRDHALSGEQFPYEKIEEWATTKKIFFVLVSHEFDKNFKTLPNSFGIQVVGNDLSLLLLPERTKLTSAMGSYQNIKWNQSWVDKLKNLDVNFESEIKTWEDSVAQAKWAYRGQRHWDRSLILFDSVHGQMMAERLRREGFVHARSYADCVSHSPKSIRTWIQPEISDDVLRGLVGLTFKDARDIPPKGLIEDLIKSIRSESEWTF
jgi:hypothetical protein